MKMKTDIPILEMAAAAQQQHKLAMLVDGSEDEPIEVYEARLFARGAETALAWALGKTWPEVFDGVFTTHSRANRRKTAAEIVALSVEAATKSVPPADAEDEDAEQEEHRLIAAGVDRAMRWVLGEVPDVLSAPMFPIRIPKTKTVIIDFLDQKIHDALHNNGEYDFDQALWRHENAWSVALDTAVQQLIDAGVIVIDAPEPVALPTMPVSDPTEFFPPVQKTRGKTNMLDYILNTAAPARDLESLKAAADEYTERLRARGPSEWANLHHNEYTIHIDVSNDGGREWYTLHARTDYKTGGSPQDAASDIAGTQTILDLDVPGWRIAVWAGNDADTRTYPVHVFDFKDHLQALAYYFGEDRS